MVTGCNSGGGRNSGRRTFSFWSAVVESGGPTVAVDAVFLQRERESRYRVVGADAVVCRDFDVLFLQRTK